VHTRSRIKQGRSQENKEKENLSLKDNVTCVGLTGIKANGWSAATTYIAA